MGYNHYMITIKTTDIYDSWFAELGNKTMQSRILARIRNVSMGHFGDHKYIGDNVSELRFHARSGIRIYYMQHGQAVIILLAGGDKDSQKKDIETAKKLVRQIKEVIK